MSHWKSFGLAIFAAVGLLGETTSSARAQCSAPPLAERACATEWSGGAAANLGQVPDSAFSVAFGINNAGQAVGYSGAVGEFSEAVEWSHGRIINLGSLPGFHLSVAQSLNNAGQAVGYSGVIGVGETATEWSHGRVINLGGLPGSTFSAAYGINDTGRAVGYSEFVSGDHGVSLTRPSGATATSSTWEAPQLAKPWASTTPAKWWDTALSAAP
jgi:probable HAF family extracellular repeat protein